MRKIIIKLPDERVDKFRLQRRGWTGRRFKTAIGLLNRLGKSFPLKDTKEKTAIVVKEGKIHKGRYKGHIVNESLASDNATYLLYAATLYLEDYVSKKLVKRIERIYLKSIGNEKE